jgi:lipopolysaccharide export LptBFGC system permease protein LptF
MEEHLLRLRLQWKLAEALLLVAVTKLAIPLFYLQSKEASKNSNTN